MLPLARRPGERGYIRQSDDSLAAAGIHKGDLIVIDLMRQPEQDELCGALTIQGVLIVRYFHKEVSGETKLSRRLNSRKFTVFAPGEVLVLGRVHRIIPAAPS